MEQKKFVIHETQSVTQLEMENLSDKCVIILAGDILKGGQQDRIAQDDQIIPPKSGKLKLQSFCVEHTAARWLRKLDGTNSTFGYSPGQLASNALRVANRKRSQAEVWRNVAGLQTQLSSNLKAEVKAKESDSSLALSLDHKKVQEEAEKYCQKLADIAKDKKNVIGYVMAINGKFVTADLYGSGQLFQKVWPRLLKANAIEAVSEYEATKKFNAPTEATCKKFMNDLEKYAPASGKDDRYAEEEAIEGRTGREVAQKAKMPDSGKSVLFETADKDHGLLRRNILAK
jgi:hypothetical protein